MPRRRAKRPQEHLRNRVLKAIERPTVRGKRHRQQLFPPTKSRHSAPSATNIGKTRRARRRTFSRC